MNQQSKETPNLDMFHHVAIVNIRKDKIEQTELKPGILKQFTISEAGNRITRAYLFQKDMFTEEQAEEWLKKRNIKFEWKKKKTISAKFVSKKKKTEKIKINATQEQILDGEIVTIECPKNGLMDAEIKENMKKNKGVGFDG